MKTLLKSLAVLTAFVAVAIIVLGQATPTTYPFAKPLHSTNGFDPSKVTKMSATVTPTSPIDDYAVVWDVMLGGSLRSVGSLVEMTNINSNVRKQGMVVFVADTGTYYQLGTNLLSWTAMNLGTGSSGDSTTVLTGAGTNALTGTAIPTGMRTVVVKGGAAGNGTGFTLPAGAEGMDITVRTTIGPPYYVYVYPATGNNWNDFPNTGVRLWNHDGARFVWDHTEGTWIVSPSPSEEAKLVTRGVNATGTNAVTAFNGWLDDLTLGPYNDILIYATGADGVMIPAQDYYGFDWKRQYTMRASGGSALIYPPDNTAINNLSTNTPFLLTDKEMVIVRQKDDSNWSVFSTAPNPSISLVAAGTNAATAMQIPAGMSYVFADGDVDGRGLRLPAGSAGAKLTIRLANSSPYYINVYPAEGERIAENDPGEPTKVYYANGIELQWDSVNVRWYLTPVHSWLIHASVGAAGTNGATAGSFDADPTGGPYADNGLVFVQSADNIKGIKLPTRDYYNINMSGRKLFITSAGQLGFYLYPSDGLSINNLSTDQPIFVPPNHAALALVSDPVSFVTVTAPPAITSTTNFTVNTYYTNDVARAIVTSSWNLTSAAATAASVGLYIDTDGNGTWDVTGMNVKSPIGVTNAATLQLSGTIGYRQRFVWTNLSGVGSTATIVTGSSQWAK